ncbi:MAG: ferritin family protein [Bacteroidales bacterium]|nr:ferritin family protein [Bacteroidales bacterium]
MNEDVKEALLKAQEGELESVVIYKYLSSIAKDPEMKDAFSKMATEEGRHAGILRKYTGQSLKRREKPKFLFRLTAKMLGIKFVMKMMLMTETKTIEGYTPAAKNTPLMRDILNDEKRHKRILEKFIEEKRK